MRRRDEKFEVERIRKRRAQNASLDSIDNIDHKLSASERELERANVRVCQCEGDDIDNNQKLEFGAVSACDQ